MNLKIIYYLMISAALKIKSHKCPEFLLSAIYINYLIFIDIICKELYLYFEIVSF